MGSNLLELTQACFNPDEIFIPNDYGTFVVLTNQRETLLNFFKSIIRDLQLNQIIEE